MTELENIRCEKCRVVNQPGIVIGRLYNMWLCGECIIKLQEKVNKEKRRLIFEE